MERRDKREIKVDKGHGTKQQYNKDKKNGEQSQNNRGGGGVTKQIYFVENINKKEKKINNNKCRLIKKKSDIEIVRRERE